MNITFMLIFSFAVFSSDLFATSYTREAVREHGTAASCWIIIDQKVYDVTSYLKEHPSKDEKSLQNSCGQDASQSWHDKGNGKPHSRKAARLLKSFYLGELVTAGPKS